MSDEAAPLSADAITVIILAGGIGSRLREVTATPKTIVPVDGKPFLVHLLDALKSKGLRHVIVGTGHGAGEVEDAVSRGNPRLDVAFSRETTPLGTAGALRLAAGKAKTSHVLAMNGDSWCDFELEKLLSFQRSHPSRPTLIATRVPNADRFGQLELDPDGRILAFREKGAQSTAGWINGGLYLLPTSVLRDLPDRAPLSLERDVMPGWIEGGFHAFRSEAPFLDIGTPESFARKEAFVRSMIESRKAHARLTMFSFPTPPADAPIKTGVGVLLVNDSGEILLEKRADCGLWGLIGGTIDSGESVSDTARREIREETGLDAVVTGLQGIYSDPGTHYVRYPDRGDVKQLIDIVVHARIVSGAPVVSAESEELRFFRRDQLPPESEIALPAREPLRDWVSGARCVLA